MTLMGKIQSRVFAGSYHRAQQRIAAHQATLSVRAGATLAAALSPGMQSPAHGIVDDASGRLSFLGWTGYDVWYDRCIDI